MLARDAADRDHRRSGLLRDRVAPLADVVEVDHRPGGRIDLLAVDREDGMPGVHEVDLLVPELLLGVLLDDLVARVRGRVGVDPEGRDAERLAHGLPDERAEHGNALDVLQPQDLHARESRTATSASVARGPIAPRFVQRAWVEGAPTSGSGSGAERRPLTDWPETLGRRLQTPPAAQVSHFGTSPAWSAGAGSLELLLPVDDGDPVRLEERVVTIAAQSPALVDQTLEDLLHPTARDCRCARASHLGERQTIAAEAAAYAAIDPATISLMRGVGPEVRSLLIGPPLPMLSLWRAATATGLVDGSRPVGGGQEKGRTDRGCRLEHEGSPTI